MLLLPNGGARRTIAVYPSLGKEGPKSSGGSLYYLALKRLYRGEYKYERAF
jgi:hypothetical protein